MNTDISVSALKCLKHMLGVNDKKPEQAGYRNYFAAGKGQVEVLEELVNADLAIRGAVTKNLTYYHANANGCDKAGLTNVQKNRALNDA